MSKSKTDLADDFAHKLLERETRRQFFGRGARGLGSAALMTLLGERMAGAAADGEKNDAASQLSRESGPLAGLPHFAPKAKRAIWLHMVGAPPQQDLFDWKPKMKEMFNKDLPESVRKGQRLTTMTSGQGRFPIAPTIFKFQQHGRSGAWISELLPHTAKVVDELAIIKTVNTEAINHEPAITFIQTGNQLPGRPCLGAWLSYGLGSMNRDLPTFVVLNASHSNPAANVQAISARLWSAGFLPAEHAGVSLRSSGDPVLYINNPPGVDSSLRRRMLDSLNALNQIESDRLQDPETQSRIAQYEMAFRMQSSVPELTNLTNEPEHIHKLYGDDSRKPGTFAQSCLLTRRLLERGVRFVQIYHRGWDVHGNLPGVLPSQCRDIDQASAALILDLKQRGMLDDTLIVWGGEFGRTVYCQGNLTDKDYGRDHHPKCYTMWMAGGGVKPGVIYGKTDEIGYNVVENPVHVHDLQATILHLLGLDHTKLTYRFQGRDFRLTDVAGEVVSDILI